LTFTETQNTKNKNVLNPKIVKTPLYLGVSNEK